MERRLVVFAVTAFAVIMGYNLLIVWLYPPKPRPKPAVVAKADQKPSAKPQAKPAEKPREDKPEKPEPVIKAAPEPKVAEQWVTLGSADEKSPYRMLVTLTNRGAAVARIELSSPRYCDIDYRGGYLGHLTMKPGVHKDGCPIELVGPGTPAAEAGLRPGDVLTAIGGHQVIGRKSFDAVLANMRPGRIVKLLVVRDGKELTLPAKLRRRPLDVIQPEADDPLSMLLTLQQFDKAKLSDMDQKSHDAWSAEDKERNKGSAEEEAALAEKRYLELLDRELKGVDLRTANWRIVPTSNKDEVAFQRTLPEKGLEITKTYRLAQVPGNAQKDSNFPAYHLEFDIQIRNIGRKAHQVAYRLDGPNGLPIEGQWYASKVSRNWGGAGLRDFVVSFGGRTPEMIGASNVGTSDNFPKRPDTPPAALLSFIGVDAQYFSAILIPQRPNPADVWFAEVYPIRVGKVIREHTNLTNTSCRLVSMVADLNPGQKLTHGFRFFTGPKKPAILENKDYNLGELNYYGWPIFAAVAVPLTAILHFFYGFVWNYGLAIILLTVLVRGCMFPLSLKQAAGAQKMQILQPEIKKLAEKHKNDSQARMKAQQELFRKHNYNPMAGCLPIFIQMPIFIGLYRCLMVDIELRDAPLISHAIRWCSNLAAPDMLFNWSGFMPEFINNGVGIMGLGPYFNILPIVTIILFIMQQKIMMPPAADEQAAMQQKMMKYMMIFMGVMFFKVASGLCIYFIVSTLWGFGERRFLPKHAPASNIAPQTRADAKARARDLAAKMKK